MLKTSKKFDKLAENIYLISKDKGFWDIDDISDFAIVPIKLALIADEVSEALRVHRDDYDGVESSSFNHMTEKQEQDFTEELADIIIRVLDLAGGLNLNIGEAVVEKIKKNKNRPNKHNKRY